MRSLCTMHIIGSRFSGGAERFYTRLIQALAERGLETLAVNRRGSAVSKELAGIVGQKHVAMRNVRDPFSRWRISRIIRDQNPEIVQTYMGRATRLTRVPENCGAIHIARLGGFYKLDGYRHADAWVGNTRSICEYLLDNGFPSNRVFHLPNFVERSETPSPEVLKKTEAALRLPENAWKILGLGRLVEKKGFFQLIESFTRLPEEVKGRPIHLIIVGSGPEEKKLRELARQGGVSDRVHWTGWQSDPDPYYALADLFVCPSLHEPLGNVILEAWSNETPVLSTMTHGALELIEDNINGLLIPCGEPGIMADTMEHFLKQAPSFTAGLVSGGLTVLSKRFGKKAVVDSYIGLYEKLLSEKTGR